MKRIFFVLAISIMALTFAVSGAYAASEMMKGKSTEIMKGSRLIGAAIENIKGEKLGKISDLIYDSRDNRVTFAILSHGGVLGIGDKLIAVPITALTFRDEDNAILDITKDKLATAPSFEKNKWPDMASRQWTEDTYKFFGVSPKWEHKGMEREMKEEMKEMKGKSKSGY